MRFRNIILFVIGSLLISCSQNDTVFRDTEGNTVKLSQLKDKWIIVNYWASWCEGCIKEVPELNHFYLHNKDKNILMYSVNFDRLQSDNLNKALIKAHIRYPALTDDPGQSWRLAEVDVLPTTFIINPEGKVVKTMLGPNTEQSLLNTLHLLQNSAR